MTALEFGTVELATVTCEMIEDVPEHTPFEKRLYVTVPPALVVAPVRTEESDAELPTTMVVEERLVTITTPFGLTVRSSHGLVAALLLASPLNAAFQLYNPAALNG